MLTGPPGIGKTALMDEPAEEGRAQGQVVLRSAPIEQDRELPFVTLVDLLAEVGDEQFGRLAEPQRAALDAALGQGRSPRSRSRPACLAFGGAAGSDQGRGP